MSDMRIPKNIVSYNDSRLPAQVETQQQESAPLAAKKEEKPLDIDALINSNPELKAAVDELMLKFGNIQSNKENFSLSSIAASLSELSQALGELTAIFAKHLQINTEKLNAYVT